MPLFLRQSCFCFLDTRCIFHSYCHLHNLRMALIILLFLRLISVLIQNISQAKPLFESGDACVFFAQFDDRVKENVPVITSAFKKLKEYGGFYQGTEHRTIKYLNNLIEQDHRPVKRRNKFYRSLRTASTTIKGMEAIRGLYKKTRKEGTLFGFSVCTEIKILLGIPA